MKTRKLVIDRVRMGGAKKIDIPFVQTGRGTIDTAQAAVANHFNVAIDDVKYERRYLDRGDQVGDTFVVWLGINVAIVNTLSNFHHE